MVSSGRGRERTGSMGLLEKAFWRICYVEGDLMRSRRKVGFHLGKRAQAEQSVILRLCSGLL